MMKKWILLGVVASTMLIATACGASAEEMSPEELPQDDAAVEEEAKGPETIDAFGVVEPTKEHAVSVDFNARVEKLHVKVGERFGEGDPLVDFDISELTNEIKSTEMDIEETKIELMKVDNSPQSMSMDLQSSREELETLEKELAGKKILFDSGAVSAKDYESFEDQVNQKRRYVQKMELDQKNSEIAATGNRLMLQNKLEKLEDTLKTLNDKYSKANFVNGNQIVSKISNGVVTKIDVQEGSFVNREIKVISYVDLDSRIINADIAEEFIGRITEGMKVTATSQSMPDKEYHGTVSRIWGTSTKKGGETIVPIEITLDDMDDQLYLYFNVDVKIFLDEATEE